MGVPRHGQGARLKFHQLKAESRGDDASLRKVQTRCRLNISQTGRRNAERIAPVAMTPSKRLCLRSVSIGAQSSVRRVW